MSYRPPKIEVPLDNPFFQDKLERSETVKFLASIIDRSSDYPLVLAIDAPYGSGKSTFVEMLRVTLDEKKYQTIYFDAWRADHVNDPLVAMVAALDTVVREKENFGGKAKVNLDVVRKLAGTVAKRGVVAAVKVATIGVLDLEEDVEEIIRDFAGDATSDLVGEFQKEEKLIAFFRNALEQVIAQLPSLNKNKTLVFFIDELDRCRPDFAISLLERVKHMFDVPNIAFVLSVDKKQLEAVTAAIYGDRIDASEYLRKFIDLEFGLASATSRLFLDSSVTRMGLDEVFAQRSGSHETRLDREHFVDVLFALARIFHLSLRAQERCITRLKLVLEQTPSNSYLNPEHVGLMIVLRLVDQNIFNRVASGALSPDELLEFMNTKPNGPNVLNSDDGRILMAMVLAEDRDTTRLNKRVALLREQINSGNLSDDEQATLQRRLELIQHFSNWRGRRAGSAYKQAAKKIDIASQIRE
jgi:hypothetical protein